MILSYKKKYLWGKQTNFKEKILEGTKVHTFREDPHGRWLAGRHIHHAHGVRTKYYDCFLENDCVSVQSVQIHHYESEPPMQRIEIIIDGEVVLSPHCELMEKIAKNDGFGSVDDFFKWFNTDFHGKIIHWTNLKY